VRQLSVLSAVLAAMIALPAVAQTNVTDSAYVMFPACKAYVAASVRTKTKPPATMQVSVPVSFVHWRISAMFYPQT